MVRLLPWTCLVFKSLLILKQSEFGLVNEDSTRYLVENILVAEKLNVPPASVNIANVQSQWKHLADMSFKMWTEQKSRSSLEVTSKKSLSQGRCERDLEVHHLESKLSLLDCDRNTPKIFSRFRIRVFYSCGFT